jgi:hypothetical protein
MRNKVVSVCSLLIIVYLTSSGGKIFGQDRVLITAGAGFPEMINFGIKYRLDQSQLGGSIAWLPGKPDAWIMNWDNLFSISGDYYYHFGGTSEFSDLRPWYGRFGLNYLIMVDMDSELDKTLKSYLRTGRDFYFNEYSGISIDAGIGLHFEISEEGSSSSPEITKTLWVAPLPVFGICLFYQF